MLELWCSWPSGLNMDVHVHVHTLIDAVLSEHNLEFPSERGRERRRERERERDGYGRSKGDSDSLS